VAGEKILVVDDSKQMREFLIQLVQLEGFEVSTAKDGSEGLSHALKDSPALIITDQAMPGLTGLEMMEELRESGSDIPAILITAEGSEEIASRALRAGVMDYFIKPFDPIELQEAIHRILGATRVGSVRTGVPDQRRLDALNTLISIGKSVTSLLDLEQILFRVTEAAVYLTGAEEGTLMLVDEETGELYVRVSKNLAAGLQSMRLAVRDSLAGRVIRTGTPLLIGEGQQKIKTHYLVHSLLYAPLKVQDRVIGVLGVHNRIVDRPLSQADVGIISALADYAAIAIVNAQLYATSETERTKLSRIVQQIQDAVILVDYEGRVALCNYVGHEFLNGVGPEGPVGRWLADVTQSSALLDLLDDDPDQLVRHGEVELPDGRVFNAQVSEVKGVGRAIVMQDITHLKELNRIKSELLTMASHDLRSPLTAILTYVDLIDRMGNLNDKQRDFGENIKASVQSITDLIDDLLQLNQIEAGLDRHRERASLDQVVRHTIEALKGQADVKHQLLTVNVAGNVPQVFGDPIRLRQMLMNLVSNAIKYTPDGGVVGVSLFEEGGEAVLVVSDTGIGIPAEDQPHIFDKFYRVDKNKTDFQGLGLGLSIVRSIVDLHNGRVWVESQPGQGTTFTVVLPAAKTTARYEPQGEST
jgi:two-component system, OmpR family, phosphate regulon sensor histidine kinase PhoR